MKKFVVTLMLIVIFIGVFLIKKDSIITIINTYFAPQNLEVKLDEKNDYYREYDFQFVQNTANFSPNNLQDILNIYYTVLNAGKTSFTFYCPKSYEYCLDDVQDLANDQDMLSDINNYVHPYNSFSHIETEYDTLGRVTINTVKSYTNDQIEQIETKVNELLPQLTNNMNSLEVNIRNIHDYIINTTKYDSDKSDRNISNYQSDIAYGPLFEGYGICGGYTDLMEIFLEKLNVKSFKISSEEHIWNAVYLNNHWYHLDLTWDDPVSSDGRDYLEYNYFLIDTARLHSLEITQHTFDMNSYPEFGGM